MDKLCYLMKYAIGGIIYMLSIIDEIKSCFIGPKNKIRKKLC
jgi:hypothetical protein